MGEEPRIGDHRWWITDLAPFKADYPDWKPRYGVEEILREMYEQNARALERGRGMKLSVVIPAHNEEGSVGGTVEGIVAVLGARARSTTRCRRRRRQRGLDRQRRGRGDRGREPPGPLLAAPTTSRASGMAIRAGLDLFEGDAVAIVMADASDDPEDLVRYYRLLEEGWDCAFGSRFMPGAAGPRLPAPEADHQPARQLVHPDPLPPRYNDTTNAFKAYRREVIETIQPLLSKHFNLTVEMPLKAIVRGHSLRGRSRSPGPTAPAGCRSWRCKEMGSRYLFIVLYVWLESTLSRGDYQVGKSVRRKAEKGER